MNMTETGHGVHAGGKQAKLNSDEPAGWAERHFVLFAFLGAIGVLFHESQWYTFTDFYGTMIATGGALLVLCRPTSLWRWALMHLGIVIEVVEKAPFSSNHTVFHMYLSMAMLVAVGARFVAGGFKPMSRGEVFRLIAPVGRVMILVLYFFTFWHKFNWGFLNADLSCGVMYYQNLRNNLPFLPDAQWTVWPSIIGTLVTEICLFVLLLFRRLRLFGLVFVLLFHGVVGSMNHPNFSAIAYGYLILFLPMEGSGRFVSFWQGVLHKYLGIDWAADGERWLARLRLIGWVGTAGVLAWMAYIAAVVIPHHDMPIDLLREPWDDPRNRLQRSVKRLFQIYGVTIFFGVYVVALWGTRWTWSKPFYKFKQPWAYLLPLLMFMHGMAPYFGGRTESSFSMFSNLITEPGHANHVVLSWVPYFTDFQNERVTIVDSSDPELADFAERGYALHWFELQRYVQRKVAAGQGGFSVSYLRGPDMLGVIESDRRNGRLVEVDVAGEDPDLNQSHSLFVMKYMYLRPFKYAERNTCGH